MMNKLVGKRPSPNPEIIDQASQAQQMAVIAALITWLTTMFFTFVAVQVGSWQMFGVIGTGWIYLGFCFFCLWLIQRSRYVLATQLLIAGLLLSFLVLSNLVADVGLVLGSVGVLLTSLIAGRVLPSGLARIVIISIAAGIGLVLFDLILPALAPTLDYRLVIPPVWQTFIQVSVGAVIISYLLLSIDQFFSYTLQTKLILAFLLVTLVSIGLLTLINDWSNRRALTDAANQKLLGAATQTATNVDTFLKASLDAVRAEAQLPILTEYLNLPVGDRRGGPVEAEVLAVLQSLSRKDRVYITSYGLIDRQGLAVLDTSPVEMGQNKFIQDYYQQPISTGLPYVSTARLSDTNDQFMMYFSAPIRNISGEIIGVLRVRYDAAILQKLIYQNNDLAGLDSFAMLLDDEQIMLAHGKAPDSLFKSLVPLLPLRLAELQGERRIPYLLPAGLSLDLPTLAAGLAKADTAEPYFTAEVLKDEDDDGLEQVAVTRLATQPWLVAFAQPEQTFLRPVESQARLATIVAVILGVVVAGIALVLGQYLAGPIVRLTAVARRVSGGDLTAQAPVEAHDETGQLAIAFNSMTGRLHELIDSLENQVRERTADLAISMEVGQRAATIRNLSELLTTITGFIQERFNLYYTQIYFLDDLDQNLVLRAGTGTAGEQLMAARHSLPVGGHSIVGQVAAEGQSIVVSDTENSIIHHPNPLLPQTRSEVAVPLIVEGRVIGVLDMQADQPDTFSMKNLTVFEAMATQLAIAIDSARQWTLAQEAQQRAEEALQQLTREAWTAELMVRRRDLGYVYDLSRLEPLSGNGSAGEAPSLSAPVVVQNQPIGRLSVVMPPNQPWTAEAQSLLEVVAQQLAQKAENLRLFEATRQRASREQVVRQITDKIRASRDVETALKTAAEELAHALGTAKTVVDLRLMPVDQPADNSPE